MDTHNDPDIDSPTTIPETPISQMLDPPKHQTATTDQPEAPSLAITVELESGTAVAETPPEQIPTTTETTTETTPHPTMDLTTEEFPTLPSRTAAPNSDTQETADIAEFSDDSMEPSSAVTNKTIQTTFKRPRDLTSDSEENPNTTQLNPEQRNAVIKVGRELHKYSFRDVDKLQHINMDKKRRIISKKMYIELGDFHPSNEYVLNYSYVKTIRLHRRLTEKKIDPETFYLQIQNQIAKQDKPKRTKHT